MMDRFTTSDFIVIIAPLSLTLLRHFRRRTLLFSVAYA
jgi:hypothetical protein